MNYDVTIEVPQGSRNKYEIDHETGRVHLDRYLFTSMGYPADYGYFENTLGEDGDPLDALVFTQEPVFPGVIVSVRPIAVFNMVDDAGPDAKVLCVPVDPRFDHIQDLDDIDKTRLDEIEHFFQHYKDLEPNKFVESAQWEGKDAAEKEVAAAVKRAKTEQH
ncbi:MAG: inorganic diphosphatase [Micrococcaceae bacterium]